MQIAPRYAASSMPMHAQNTRGAPTRTLSVRTPSCARGRDALGALPKGDRMRLEGTSGALGVTTRVRACMARACPGMPQSISATPRGRREATAWQGSAVASRRPRAACDMRPRIPPTAQPGRRRAAGPGARLPVARDVRDVLEQRDDRAEHQHEGDGEQQRPAGRQRSVLRAQRQLHVAVEAQLHHDRPGAPHA